MNPNGNIEDHIGYEEDLEQIAVVGLATRLPDAPDLDHFWQNLRDGKESVRHFSDEELDDLGIPQSVYRNPSFVPMGTELPDMDRFDARLFGYTPRQAEMIDPQSRVFLETSYTALEHSGYDPYTFDEPIGVFAGSNPNDYAALLQQADLTDPAGSFDRLIGMEKDFLATRVAHRLDLTGPALNVQTACSTSLVAVHLACQSLLTYESKMALAGGVAINLRQSAGYIHQEGMILSPDGHCRAFDADAQGTRLGQGCGVVVLKRLSEALADGDTIHAVIKASAINNDGSTKVSYTAPSEDGQVEVITTALSLAGVEADDITYVETHGTGTSLGDPIEIAALTRAFAATTSQTGYCAIGSVKTNVGHTDAASGVTGLIKAILAVKHGEIPASLNFERPNPSIDFERTPFFVNTELRQWEPAGPRRAGVSSFGIGGTNAHIIVEEPPQHVPSSPSSGLKVLPLSARTATAVGSMASNLADHLEQNTDLNLKDVAFTLQAGRAHHEYRSFVIADDATSPTAALRDLSPPTTPANSDSNVVFMFTGQGAQYPNMARELYETSALFSDEVDRCATILETTIGRDIRELLFPDVGTEEAAAELLAKTEFTQPALFVIEWATAQLFMSWGVEPDAVVGHSIGEYVAATLAGIFSLENALRLVASRGRLMQSLPAGSMLAVQAPQAEVRGLLNDHVELAAINSSQHVVVSGEAAAVEAFAEELDDRQISCQRLHTSHAFHSRMMEPILENFAKEVAAAAPRVPELAMLSNVTGTWLTPDQASDPQFWASQIRQPVCFADNVEELLQQGNWTFLELGPGRGLATFVRQNDLWSPEAPVVTAIRHPKQERSDLEVSLEAVGRLWASGVEPNWTAVGHGTRRVPLPTYPFERQRFWAPQTTNVLALDRPNLTGMPSEAPTEQEPIDNWYYLPTWRRGPPVDPISTNQWLVFANDDPLSEQLISTLSENDEQLHVVRPGQGFELHGGNGFRINPAEDADYQQLIAELDSRQALPDAVVHLWMAQADASAAFDERSLKEAFDLGVHSILSLARALGKQDATRPVRLELVTAGSHSVIGTERIRPEATAVQGPCKVIPLEYSNLETRAIDLPTDDVLESLPVLVRELRSAPSHQNVSLRGHHRWLPGVEQHKLAARPQDQMPLRQGGVYLIVGGLGGVGLSVAEHLARNVGAKLALVSRSGRPDPTADDSNDSEVQGRAEALSRIEATASEVVVLKASILDEADLCRAVEEAEARLGPIDGVLVAAAVLDNAGSIHNLNRDELERVMGTKVLGSQVVKRIFAGRQLDFVAFSSSMSTVLFHNRFGQVGYVTANSYVEAVPLTGDWGGTPVFTVSWDDFLQYGMSVRAANAFAERTNHGDVSLMDRIHSFSPEEGGVIFERCLLSGHPQIYISTTDLIGRIARDSTAVSPFLEHALASDGEMGQTVSTDDVAAVVASVWKDLLGYETISVHGDFFELGGDSLQVARMADRLGALLTLSIPLNLIFEAPTITQFAERIDELRQTGGTSIVADQGPIQGSFPLSPAQTRFLSRGSASSNRWNVSVLLRPTERLEAHRVERAFALLMAHHDAMRLRIRKTGDTWIQECAEPVWDPSIYRFVDLTNVPSAEHQDHVLQTATALHGSLDLAKGPVVRLALFDMGGSEQRLFIVTHHLMTDRVSLLRMLDDFQDLYIRLGDEEEPALPQKTTSYKTWVESLVRYAESDDAEQDLQAWLELPWSQRADLPQDFPVGPESNTNNSAATVVQRLEWPGGLPSPGANGPRLDEATLAALSIVIAEWSHSSVAVIDGVGHGRRTFEAPIDVSRTIGFFFTYGTVIIDTSSPDPEAIVEQIRSFGSQSWTLEALRHLRQAKPDEPQLPNQAQVLFNYVGRELSADPGLLMNPVDEPKGSEHDPEGRRDHQLAVMIEILADETLEVKFVYSTNLHQRETIQTLANRFKDTLEQILPMAHPQLGNR